MPEKRWEDGRSRTKAGIGPGLIHRARIVGGREVLDQSSASLIDAGHDLVFFLRLRFDCVGPEDRGLRGTRHNRLAGGTTLLDGQHRIITSSECASKMAMEKRAAQGRIEDPELS